MAPCLALCYMPWKGLLLNFKFRLGVAARWPPGHEAGDLAALTGNADWAHSLLRPPLRGTAGFGRARASRTVTKRIN